MTSLQLQTKILLAGISGILIARSYTFPNGWILIPIGIAVWWAGTHKRPLSDYLIFSTFFSLGYWFTHIAWISSIGIDAYILSATLMSLIYTSSGYFMFKVRDLYFPFAWYALIFISIETLTDFVPFGGFPWGKIAYGSADAPWANLMPFGSAPLASLAILLVAILLIPLVGFVLQKAFFPAIVFSIFIFAFVYSIDGLKIGYDKSSKSMNLALIQGSVPRSGLLFNEQKLEVLNFHSIETKKLLSQSNRDIDAIFWPENAIDVDPFKNAQAAEYINEILNLSQKPLLAGAVIQEFNGLSNSVGLWNPLTSNVEQEYVKSILVPFGEYLPFRETLSKYIRRFDLIPQDFIPGKYPNNIDIDGSVISPIICFEIAWNKTLNEQVINGGQLISVHTNNATYAFSNQIDQQFTMTRLRALEMGREVVISATTGISAHIDRSGKALWQSNEFVPQSKIVQANLYSDLTPAVRYSKEIGFISLFGIFLPFILLLLRYGYRKL